MIDGLNFFDYLSTIGKTEEYSWQEIADIYGLASGNAARNVWGRYRRAKTDGRDFIPLTPTLADKLEQSEAVKEASTANYIAELEESLITKILESETDHTTGNQKLTIQSSKPLSPKELEELAGVDNISTFIDRSWLKSHKNNTWTYSILTVSKIKDFYNTSELTDKLKEIFASHASDSTVKEKVAVHVPTDRALFIYIGDDHAGSLISDSLYNRTYSGKSYTQRLLAVSKAVKELEGQFDAIYILRMGDELDGFNGKTTRYDHDLDSASNKEQFDIYTTANKLFYGDVLSSGKADQFHIINLNNSNHSGNGYSYIANKALEFWIEGKFHNVTFKHQQKFIDIIKFGNHIIGLTHGKDEKYMKSPMPLNLDHKTDLWLMDYYKQFKNSGAYISTIKADIHKYNVNQGKSGRYVNVPSISSGSNWIEHNYGDSEPGCLLEIYTADSKNIQSIPIWF